MLRHGVGARARRWFLRTAAKKCLKSPAGGTGSPRQASRARRAHPLHGRFKFNCCKCLAGYTLAPRLPMAVLCPAARASTTATPLREGLGRSAKEQQSGSPGKKIANPELYTLRVWQGLGTVRRGCVVNPGPPPLPHVCHGGWNGMPACDQGLADLFRPSDTPFCLWA